MGLGQKNYKVEGKWKNINIYNTINVIGGLENVMVVGFCDVVMQSLNLNNV